MQKGQSDPNRANGQTGGSKNYVLDAVVIHVGSDNCGHYYVCRKINDTWYKCNDTIIQQIPSGVNQPGAYIMMYSKA